MLHQNCLSLLIWLPILGALLVLISPRGIATGLAMVVSLLSLGLCVPLITGFDISNSAMQFVENYSWFTYQKATIANYALGIDGIGLPLVVLTTLFGPIVILSSLKLKDRVQQYHAAFLMMQGLMVGVFSATDALLFYVFFEATLIPMFLIIGIWGGANRIYATIKFFLFTFFGSVFLLVALVYLYLQAKAAGMSAPLSIANFQQLPLSMLEQQWLFVGMFLAFAIKIPMFPVHTWLPDAHVEAPTEGSVILAAIMLKMGAYGFIRFLLPILPDGSRYFADAVMVLSLIAVVYIGLIAIVQKDMKKLIAYSSIAHMGFVTFGIFMVFDAMEVSKQVAIMGMQGAYFQMISHGFISGALFLCIGVLYERMHTRKIEDFGGVVNTMPHFASFFLLFAMANSGLPGTSGFVGEFLVILAGVPVNFWFAALLATTLIFGAAYNLWMFKRVVFGKVVHSKVQALKDIKPRETLVLSLLAALVIGFGLFPKPILEFSEPCVETLIDQLDTKIPSDGNESTDTGATNEGDSEQDTNQESQ